MRFVAILWAADHSKVVAGAETFDELLDKVRTAPEVLNQTVHIYGLAGKVIGSLKVDIKMLQEPLPQHVAPSASAAKADPR